MPDPDPASPAYIKGWRSRMWDDALFLGQCYFFKAFHN